MSVDVPADPLHVVVDCDPGVDDAIALLMLANLHHARALVLDAVVASAGNADLARTTANAAMIMDRAGLSHVPVYAGEAMPRTSHWPRVDASAFHGRDALAGLYDTDHMPVRAAPRGAEALSLALRSSATDQRTLLVTGPLTTLAAALHNDPELGELMHRVVLMGGALGSPAGNITPWAEFNFYSDPVAASEVCTSPLPLELVPLDVTELVHTTTEQVSQLMKSAGTELAVALISGSIVLHQRALHVDWCTLHDAIAALRLINPTLFETDRLEVRVAEAGDRAGAVHAAAPRSPQDHTIEIATSVDATTANAEIVRLLTLSSRNI